MRLNSYNIFYFENLTLCFVSSPEYSIEYHGNQYIINRKPVECINKPDEIKVD